MKGEKDAQGFTEEVCTNCNKVIYLLKEFNTPEFNASPLCRDCEQKTEPEVLNTKIPVEELEKLPLVNKDDDEYDRIQKMDEVF